MNPIIEYAHRHARLGVLFAATIATACSESASGPSALTVISSTPAAAAQNVGIEATVQIQFSADINAATVTSSSVKVERDGTPVAGTLAVAGSTVTFTPTALLTEFNTAYTVTVTTGVRAASGGRLAADVMSDFTTAFWDPAFYYRMTNLFQGPTLSLDTYGGSFACFMGDTGGYSGQYWYFTPIGVTGYYTMRNAFQGDALALEGANSPDACFLGGQTPAGGFYSGQYWKPIAYDDGYRMQNLSLGDARSLDVTDVGGGTYVPMMTDTGTFTGQQWYFTRLIKR